MKLLDIDNGLLEIDNGLLEIDNELLEMRDELLEDTITQYFPTKQPLSQRGMTSKR